MFAMFGFIELFVGLLLLPLILLGTIFWIWMLVDCAIKEKGTSNDKLVWILIILFTHLLGAILYYFARRPQRIQEFGA
jgi:hypothetical protein